MSAPLFYIEEFRLFFFTRVSRSLELGESTMSFLDGSSGHAGPTPTRLNLLELGGGGGWWESGEERPLDRCGEWGCEGQRLRPQPADAHRRPPVQRRGVQPPRVPGGLSGSASSLSPSSSPKPDSGWSLCPFCLKAERDKAQTPRAAS